MNKTPINQQTDFESDDLLPKYNFDYTKARPNRFATTSENKIIANTTRKVIGYTIIVECSELIIM
jgi:hypothetical protein